MRSRRPAGDVRRVLVAAAARCASLKSGSDKAPTSEQQQQQRQSVVSADRVLEGLPALAALAKNSRFGQEVLRQSMSEFEATQAAMAQASLQASAASSSGAKASPATAKARFSLLGGAAAPSTTASGGSLLQRQASLTLGQQLAQSKEREALLRRKGEGESRGFLARLLLRRRAIDVMGLQVEENERELGVPHRLARSFLNLATVSPVVLAVLSGAVEPSRLPVALGLTAEESWVTLFGAEDGLVPPWLCFAGDVALLLFFYDLSVYWRYPLLFHVAAPALRRWASRKTTQGASVAPAAAEKEPADNPTKPKAQYSTAAASFVGGAGATRHQRGGAAAAPTSWRSSGQQEAARGTPKADA